MNEDWVGVHILTNVQSSIRRPYPFIASLYASIDPFFALVDLIFELLS